MGIIAVLFNPIELPPEKDDDAYSFCPKCKAQYKKGFDMCSDSKIELVNFRGDEE